ncbi:MAG TPA: bifunctional demethylmenaquinone methyltransferase/2-methoxy-6-polyprenyl-1,4-benzoquinol methylase UbiE [Pantanalinema sp.]
MSYNLPNVEDKPAYVRGMFDRIAGNYDRVNRLMTGGRDAAWKRTVLALAGATRGGSYLDLCTGTGDIAFLLAEAAGAEGSVKALDFSPGMLEVARARPWDGPVIDWLQGDACALPFEDASFDAVTVGYGLRNVQQLDLALSEIRRVLKPAGRFVTLDLGKPKVKIVRWGAEVYEYRIVPAIGSLFSGDREAYRYLPHSNSTFPDQRELAERLRALGFQEVKVHDRMLGAIAIVAGTR